MALCTSSGVTKPSQEPTIGSERRRRGPPDPWCRWLGEQDGGVAAVVGAQPDQVVGGAGAERDALGLRLPSGICASDVA